MAFSSNESSSSNRERRSAFSNPMNQRTANNFANPENHSKNRSLLIPCWDHSRVILSNNCYGRPSTSDYIHANWIDGYETKNKYIATQAPMQNTLNDFFDMVMQNTARHIIVLTDFMESGERMCFPYWPSSYDLCYSTDRWSLQLITKYQNNGYTKNLLKLVHNHLAGNDLNLVLYNFTNWSEIFYPKIPKQYRNFVSTVRKEINDYRHLQSPFVTPIIIHSSFGVDRPVEYCISHEILDMKSDMKFLYSREVSKKIEAVAYWMRHTKLQREQ